MPAGSLRFDRVSKRFRRGTSHDRLGEVILSGIRWLAGGKKSSETFWALQDVTFEARPGEAVGVIGPNGAGKSTALKLAAGILRPDQGRIRTCGRLTALIEISAGFHGDLTGRENVYMNGSILGMPKAEIDRKLDAIVAFSGIEEFIDTPVKRYSSGMQARLGFSVAAHVDPDVLLVDEVLSVGDVLFRQRCVRRMRELVESGTVLLFVTHNLEQMQSFCSRAVVLHRGGVTFDGDTTTAVGHYLSALGSGEPGGWAMAAPGRERITHLTVQTPDGRELAVTRCTEPVEVVVGFHLSRRYPRLAVEVDVRRELGSCLANFSSIRDEVTFDASAGHGRATLALPQLPLGGGHYLFRALLRDADSTAVVADTGYWHSTAIEDGGKPTGILCLPHDWRYVGERVAGVEAERVGAAG